MQINLEGGYIEAVGEWSNVHGEKRPMWTAVSTWTGETIENFYTRGLAEFWVWTVNEKFASMKMRGPGRRRQDLARTLGDYEP